MTLRGMDSLTEAERYFMGEAKVQKAAVDLAAALDEAAVPYAIAGALAVSMHGHPRTTSDVDVLLTRNGLERFKRRWLGRGWVERFPGSKNLRDVRNNVKVDVLLTGDYPGDGKPKPVQFPDPAHVAVEIDGLQTVGLPELIELKLASGMTAPDRPRDFDDVIQLVRALGLSRHFSRQLDPWVRAKFLELWGYAQRPSDDY
jgi:hypothetical protein